MNILRKKSLIEITAGSPAIAGSPGRPERPGYYRTDSVVVRMPVYGTTRIPVGGAIPAGQTVISFLTDAGGNLVGFITSGIIGYQNTTTSVRTWVPAVPAIAPTPPSAARPPTTTEVNIGWDGGANTVGRETGDVAFSFKIPQASVGVAVGLTDTPAQGDYRRIKHGVYASRGKLSFVENGVIVGPAIDYAESSTISVNRSGTEVTYTVGDSAIRTSSSDLPDEVFGTAALYMAGDSVVDASFGAASAVSSGTTLPMTAEAYAGVYAQALNDMLPMTGAATGRRYDGIHASMLPMTALASNRPSGESRAQMAPLEGEATGRQFTSVSKTVMEPLAGMGADKIYAASGTVMLPLESLGNTGLLKPEVAIALNSMSYLLSAASGTTGEVGQVDAAMAPLKGFGSDRPYGYSEGVMAPMTGQTGVFVLLDGQADLAAPSPRLRAIGRSSLGDNSFVYEAPMPILTAFGGGRARLTAPRAMLALTGTGTNWGHADLQAPSAFVTATGTISETSNAALESPAARLIGYGGALASITLTGRNTITATGSTGSIGRAALTVPLFALTGEVTAQNYGSAHLTAPSAKLGGQLQAWLIAPMGRLTAIGTAVVVATREAYAVNLKHIPAPGIAPHDEVTRYTNFPFTHVVRHQGSYYGANETGLYLLEGATDDGTPIPWALKTAMDDLGQPTKKTIDSAYFGGRFGPASTVQLHAGERAPNTYSYDTPKDALAQNHRQKFGRGVKERYYALGASGDDVLELDTIELEVRNMTRRI